MPDKLQSQKFLFSIFLMERPYYTFKYVRKNIKKTNIFYPLIRTRTCARQGVRNVSSSKNFGYLLDG